MIHWEFFFDILVARGFGEKWTFRIHYILESLKANILINGLHLGYVHYQRSLRESDPFSPLLFVLVADVLSTMCSHALSSRILVGVPLGSLDNLCHLQFEDDLLLITIGGLEDLRILKFILLTFEGLSGLVVNFLKSCLYSTLQGISPTKVEVTILNCSVS